MMIGRSVLPLGVILLSLISFEATGQKVTFEDEAKATTVLVALSTLCAEEIPSEVYAYAERVAKRAWNKNWKNEIENIFTNSSNNFNAQSLRQQAETCSKIKGALAQMK